MGVQFSFLELTSYFFFSLSEVWINIIIIVFFFLTFTIAFQSVVLYWFELYILSLTR